MNGAQLERLCHRDIFDCHDLGGHHWHLHPVEVKNAAKHPACTGHCPWCVNIWSKMSPGLKLTSPAYPINSSLSCPVSQVNSENRPPHRLPGDRPQEAHCSQLGNVYFQLQYFYTDDFSSSKRGWNDGMQGTGMPGSFRALHRLLHHI